MSKHKVKQNFTHEGKSYKPGDTFESPDEHVVQSLAAQGHVDQQPDQQGQQGSAHNPNDPHQQSQQGSGQKPPQQQGQQPQKK